MNKPIHLQQNASAQTAMENKVNRNLSPSLARIQTLKTKAPPLSSEAAEDNSSHAPRPGEPKLTAPSPARAQYRPREPADKDRTTLRASPPPAAQRTTPPSSSTQITPWVIASITLTLALFSGNYAWDTQQKVDKLSQRLELIEAQTAPLPATNLLKDNDNFAKTEQEFLALKQAQRKLSDTISALQTELATDTEQAGSRLTTLETEIADLNSKISKTSFRNEPSHTQTAQTATRQPDTNAPAETKSDKAPVAATNNTAAADNSATESWFINIASFSDAKTANSAFEKVHKIEAKTSIQPIVVNGKTFYRIRANGFTTREKAEQQAQGLQVQLGLTGLWISRD